MRHSWPIKCFPEGMLLLLVSAGFALLTGFLSLSLFFATGEETDQSMAEWLRPCMPWWGTKFGIWVTLWTTAGVIAYVVLPSLLPKVFVPL